MIRFIYELSGISIALFLGLFALRYINSFYRIYFIQLLVYIAVYILSYIALIHNSNQWIYNIQMPFETGLLAWAGYRYFSLYKQKFLILTGYLIFLAVFIFELTINSPLAFASYSYVAESILLVVIYLSMLYSQLKKENRSWKRSPGIWIAIGIIIYFGGVVPYLSFMHYLNMHYRTLSYYLYNIITIGLANLRYILLAIGFWLIRRNSTTETAAIHE